MYNGFAVFTLERELSGLEKRTELVKAKILEVKARRKGKSCDRGGFRLPPISPRCLATQALGPTEKYPSVERKKTVSSPQAGKIELPPVPGAEQKPAVENDLQREDSNLSDYRSESLGLSDRSRSVTPNDLLSDYLRPDSQQSQKSKPLSSRTPTYQSRTPTSRPSSATATISKSRTPTPRPMSAGGMIAKSRTPTPPNANGIAAHDIAEHDVNGIYSSPTNARDSPRQTKSMPRPSSQKDNSNINDTNDERTASPASSTSSKASSKSKRRRRKRSNKSRSPTPTLVRQNTQPTEIVLSADDNEKQGDKAECEITQELKDKLEDKIDDLEDDTAEQLKESQNTAEGMKEDLKDIKADQVEEIKDDTENILENTKEPELEEIDDLKDEVDGIKLLSTDLNEALPEVRQDIEETEEQHDVYAGIKEELQDVTEDKAEETKDALGKIKGDNIEEIQTALQENGQELNDVVSDEVSDTKNGNAEEIPRLVKNESNDLKVVAGDDSDETLPEAQETTTETIDQGQELAPDMKQDAKEELEELNVATAEHLNEVVPIEQQESIEEVKEQVQELVPDIKDEVKEETKQDLADMKEEVKEETKQDLAPDMKEEVMEERRQESVPGVKGEVNDESEDLTVPISETLNEALPVEQHESVEEVKEQRKELAPDMKEEVKEGNREEFIPDMKVEVKEEARQDVAPDVQEGVTDELKDLKVSTAEDVNEASPVDQQERLEEVKERRQEVSPDKNEEAKDELDDVMLAATVNQNEALPEENERDQEEKGDLATSDNTTKELQEQIEKRRQELADELKELEELLKASTDDQIDETTEVKAALEDLEEIPSKEEFNQQHEPKTRVEEKEEKQESSPDTKEAVKDELENLKVSTAEDLNEASPVEQIENIEEVKEHRQEGSPDKTDEVKDELDVMLAATADQNEALPENNEQYEEDLTSLDDKKAKELKANIEKRRQELCDELKELEELQKISNEDQKDKTIEMKDELEDLKEIPSKEEFKEQEGRKARVEEKEQSQKLRPDLKEDVKDEVEDLKVATAEHLNEALRVEPQESIEEVKGQRQELETDTKENVKEETRQELVPDKKGDEKEKLEDVMITATVDNNEALPENHQRDEEEKDNLEDNKARELKEKIEKRHKELANELKELEELLKPYNEDKKDKGDVLQDDLGRAKEQGADEPNEEYKDFLDVPHAPDDISTKEFKMDLAEAKESLNQEPETEDIDEKNRRSRSKDRKQRRGRGKPKDNQTNDKAGVKDKSDKGKVPVVDIVVTANADQLKENTEEYTHRGQKSKRGKPKEPKDKEKREKSNEPKDNTQKDKSKETKEKKKRSKSKDSKETKKRGKSKEPKTGQIKEEKAGGAKDELNDIPKITVSGDVTIDKSKQPNERPEKSTKKRDNAKEPKDKRNKSKEPKEKREKSKEPKEKREKSKEPKQKRNKSNEPTEKRDKSKEQKEKGAFSRIFGKGKPNKLILSPDDPKTNEKIDLEVDTPVNQVPQLKQEAAGEVKDELKDLKEDVDEGIRPPHAGKDVKADVVIEVSPMRPVKHEDEALKEDLTEMKEDVAEDIKELKDDIRDQNIQVDDIKLEAQVDLNLQKPDDIFERPHEVPIHEHTQTPELNEDISEIKQEIGAEMREEIKDLNRNKVEDIKDELPKIIVSGDVTIDKTKQPNEKRDKSKEPKAKRDTSKEPKEKRNKSKEPKEKRDKSKEQKEKRDKSKEKRDKSKEPKEKRDKSKEPKEKRDKSKEPKEKRDKSNEKGALSRLWGSIRGKPSKPKSTPDDQKQTEKIDIQVDKPDTEVPQLKQEIRKEVKDGLKDLKEDVGEEIKPHHDIKYVKADVGTEVSPIRPVEREHDDFKENVAEMKEDVAEDIKEPKDDLMDQNIEVDNGIKLEAQVDLNLQKPDDIFEKSPEVPIHEHAKTPELKEDISETKQKIGEEMKEDTNDELKDIPKISVSGDMKIDKGKQPKDKHDKSKDKRDKSKEPKEKRGKSKELKEKRDKSKEPKEKRDKSKEPKEKRDKSKEPKEKRDKSKEPKEKRDKSKEPKEKRDTSKEPKEKRDKSKEPKEKRDKSNEKGSLSRLWGSIRGKPNKPKSTLDDHKQTEKIGIQADNADNQVPQLKQEVRDEVKDELNDLKEDVGEEIKQHHYEQADAERELSPIIHVKREDNRIKEDLAELKEDVDEDFEELKDDISEKDNELDQDMKLKAEVDLNFQKPDDICEISHEFPIREHAETPELIKDIAEIKQEIGEEITEDIKDLNQDKPNSIFERSEEAPIHDRFKTPELKEEIAEVKPKDGEEMKDEIIDFKKEKPEDVRDELKDIPKISVSGDVKIDKSKQPKDKRDKSKEKRDKSKEPKEKRDKSKDPKEKRDKSKEPKEKRGKSKEPKEKRDKSKEPKEKRDKSKEPKEKRDKSKEPKEKRDKSKEPKEKRDKSNEKGALSRLWGSIRGKPSKPKSTPDDQKEIGKMDIQVDNTNNLQLKQEVMGESKDLKGDVGEEIKQNDYGKDGKTDVVIELSLNAPVKREDDDLKEDIAELNEDVSEDIKELKDDLRHQNVEGDDDIKLEAQVDLNLQKPDDIFEKSPEVPIHEHAKTPELKEEIKDFHQEKADVKDELKDIPDINVSGDVKKDKSKQKKDKRDKSKEKRDKSKEPKEKRDKSKEPKEKRDKSKEPKEKRDKSKEPKEKRDKSKEPKEKRDKSKEPKEKRDKSKEPKEKRNKSKEPNEERDKSKEPNVKRDKSKEPKEKRSNSKDPKDQGDQSKAVVVLGWKPLRTDDTEATAGELHDESTQPLLHASVQKQEPPESSTGKEKTRKSSKDRNKKAKGDKPKEPRDKSSEKRGIFSKLFGRKPDPNEEPDEVPDVYTHHEPPDSPDAGYKSTHSPIDSDEKSSDIGEDHGTDDDACSTISNVSSEILPFAVDDYDDEQKEEIRAEATLRQPVRTPRERKDKPLVRNDSKSRVIVVTPNVHIRHPYPFGLPLRKKQFYLDEDTIFLNHAAYGAVPRDVLSGHTSYQKERETNPDEWERIKYPKIVRQSQRDLAEFINAEADHILFVESLTRTLKRVFATIEVEDGGDIILNNLTNKKTYKVMQTVAEVLSAKVTILRVETQELFSSQAIVKKYAEALNKSPKAKVVVLEHVTSTPSVVFPIKEIAAVCRSRNVYCIVAGLHGPGQVDMDMQSLEADFYIGSLSKWCFAPPGCFFLWHHARHAGVMTTFLPLFTKYSDDLSIVFATIVPALQFMEKLGGLDRVKQYTTRQLQYGVPMLEEAWKTPALHLPTELQTGLTQCIQLPQIRTLLPSKESAIILFRILWLKYKIWVEVFAWNQQLWIRLTAHVYTTKNDFNKIRDAVLELSQCKEEIIQNIKQEIEVVVQSSDCEFL